MLLLLTAGFSFAQRGGDRLERMQEELDLTAAQTEQLTQINEEFRKQRETLRATRFADEEARRTAARELRRKHRTAVKSVLTEEQQQRARELKKQHHEQRRAHRNSPEAKAKRAEVNAYKEKNVVPVLRAQRAKLTVAAEDEILLQQLRSGMEQRKAEREKLREASPEERRAARERMRGSDTEQRELARSLVSKYEFQINALMQEIEPQRKQWKADIRNIIGERPGREGDHRKEAHGSNGERGPEHRPGRHRGGDHAEDRKETMGALKFLLLEPK